MRKRSYSRFWAICLALVMVIGIMPWRVSTVSATSNLEIVSQPADYTGPVGDTAVFSVEATGEGLTYQWQVNSSNLWKATTMDGAATETLYVPIKNSRNGNQYRCIVSDSYGNSITSDAATLTVGARPLQLDILVQPEDYFGPSGDVAVFTIEAQGDGLSYQWQVNSSNLWKATTMDGATTDTLYVPIKNSRNGNQYRCIVSDTYGNSMTSEPATLIVGQRTITITYDAGSGIFANGSSIFTVEIEPGLYEFDNVEIPTREGYVFLGWTYNGRSMRFATLKADITVKADWVASYSVTYYGNGGTVFGESSYTDYTGPGYYYVYGDDVVFRDGYVFCGWATLDGAQVGRIRMTKDIELFAQWERGVQVTYDANGGVWYDEETGESYSVETILEPEGLYYIGWREPEKEGYEFDGWTIDGEWVDHINLTSPITVKAHWRKAIQVTYDPNGGYWWDGSETPDVEDRYTGEYWVAHNWPDREGYTFLGWSTDPEATTAQTDYSYELTDSTVFYAIWRQQVWITYDANGGEFGNSETVQIHYMNPGEYYYVGCERPMKKGYECVGWTDKDGNLVDDLEIWTVEGENYTFYAKWAKEVTIYYDGNGGSWDEGELCQTQFARSGENYRIGNWAPYRENYEFAGWVDENGVECDGVEIELGEDNLTFYAKWIRIYTITYDANGGYFNGWDEWNGESETIHYRTAKENEEYYFDGWRPDREEEDASYHFLGWSLDGENLAEDPMILTDDITLYALWYRIPTITYITDLGYWGDEGCPENSFVRGGNDDGSYEIDGWRPNYDGPYEFIGYSTVRGSDEVEYEPFDFIEYLEGDLTLYAVWEKLPTITYYATNGQFNNGEGTHVDWRRADQKYYVRCENPWCEGYEFNGWVDENGEPANDRLLTLQKGDEYSFYATWVRVCEVRYDPNGGAWEWGTEPEWRNERAGDFHVGFEWPQREGYEFVGWSTDPYATTAEADWDTVLTGDTTYYAVWEKKVKITLDAGEGYFYNFEDEYRYVRQGEVVMTAWFAIPERDGYIFAGWTTTDGAFVNRFRAGEDVTFVAEWLPGCTIFFDAGDGYFENGTNINWWYVPEGEYIVLYGLEEPVREGYIFAGWMIDGEFVTQFEVTGSVNLEAVWIPESEA